MRALLLTLIAIAAAACAALLAPAGFASAESAQVEIGKLEAQGFDVRLDRIGSAPLSQCEVTSVRNPQQRVEFRDFGGRGDRDLVPVVVQRSITVSLDCSGR
jgi:hypothetical protein